jgi:hypothetical protein
MPTFLDNRDWVGRPGADAGALERLRSMKPARVPDGYLELLAISDGGEGSLPVKPYNACIDDVTTMLANLGGEWHRDWLRQGFFVVGGNGGGELIAFDLRNPDAQPLVYIDMVAGADSAEPFVAGWAGFAAMLGMSSGAPR